MTLPADAAGRRRADVACDNQGALLSRVNAPAVPLPRTRGVASGELPAWAVGWEGPPSLQQLLRGGPLLEVLVVLYDIGASVCIKSSHGITDGLALAAFVRCWSACYAAPDAPPQHWPLLDRSVQDAYIAAAGASVTDGGADTGSCGCAGGGAQKTGAAASPSGAIAAPLAAGMVARLSLRAITDPSMGFHTHTRAVIGTAFHFSAEQLARIKAASATQTEAPAEECVAVSSEAAVAAPTTFDALTAMLWHAVASAKKRRGVLDTSHASPPRLFFPANIRGRMEPPLPPSFVGNATMGVLVETDSETCAPLLADMLACIAC